MTETNDVAAAAPAVRDVSTVDGLLVQAATGHQSNLQPDPLPDQPSGREPEQRPPDLSALSMPELRDYRNRLRREEDRASYWRRLVQARLDLIGSGVHAGPLDVHALTRALGGTGSIGTRQALLRVEAVDTDFPGPQGLWTAAIDPSDPDAMERIRAALVDVEAALSQYRSDLHLLLNNATDELIGRYREDLGLAMDLLPGPRVP